MDYQPSFAAILLLDADDGNGSPLATRLNKGDRTAGYLLRRALDHPQVTQCLQVAGCHAEEILYGEADDGWEFLMNPDWHESRVPGARLAMQSLPLMDGFFLSVCDDVPSVSLSAAFAALTGTYLRERRNLTRIVVPTLENQDCWPWLIDIGFRQPFMELAVSEELAAILEKHADQVARVACDNLSH